MNEEEIKSMYVCRKCLSKVMGVTLHRDDVIVRREHGKCKMCKQKKHIVYKLKI